MSSSVQPTRGLSSRDARALTVGGVVLATLLLYTFGIRPWVATITARRAEVTQQMDLFVRERALLQGAAQLPRARSQVTQALNSSRSRFFAGDSVTATSALASYVDDVATATGVRVTSIEGRPPLRSGALSSVSVELRGEARFAAVLAFIRTMESAGYLIAVPALRIERAMRGDVVTVTATLSGAAMGRP